jgi:hypothetical protein
LTPNEARPSRAHNDLLKGLATQEGIGVDVSGIPPVDLSLDILNESNKKRATRAIVRALKRVLIFVFIGHSIM